MGRSGAPYRPPRRRAERRAHKRAVGATQPGANKRRRWSSRRPGSALAGGQSGEPAHLIWPAMIANDIIMAGFPFERSTDDSRQSTVVVVVVFMKHHLLVSLGVRQASRPLAGGGALFKKALAARLLARVFVVRRSASFGVRGRRATTTTSNAARLAWRSWWAAKRSDTCVALFGRMRSSAAAAARKAVESERASERALSALPARSLPAMSQLGRRQWDAVPHCLPAATDG